MKCRARPRRFSNLVAILESKTSPLLLVLFHSKCTTTNYAFPPIYQARYDGLHLKKKFFKPRPAEELAYEQELQKLAQLTSPRSWSKATSTTAGGGRVHVSGTAAASSMSASLTAGYSSDAADALMRTSGWSRSLNRSSRTKWNRRSLVVVRGESTRRRRARRGQRGHQFRGKQV